MNARPDEDWSEEPPPTEQELREAERLRALLEDGARATGGSVQGPEPARTPEQLPEKAAEQELSDFELIGALRAAHTPAPIDPEHHAHLLAQALGDPPHPTRARPPRVGFARRGWVWTGAGAAVLALAASVVLVLQPPRAARPGAAVGSPRWALSRPTSELVAGLAQGATGGASERIDRIASVRARDLRENQFARWGVR